MIVSAFNEFKSVNLPSDPELAFLESLSDPAVVINQQGQICHLNSVFLNDHTLKNQHFMLGSHFLEVYPGLNDCLQFPLSRSFRSKVIEIKSHEVFCRFHFHSFVWPEQHLLILKSGQQQDLLQLVLDSIPARVFWKDLDSRYLGGNYLFANDCGAQTSEELIGMNDYDVFPVSEAENFRRDDRKVMDSGEPVLNIEEPQTRPDGSISWLQTSKVPIRDREGIVIGIMGSYTDITERVQYRQMIEKQAHFDYLTGLANRLALKEKIDEIHQSHVDFGGGLLFIDLDLFKTVNDTLGHQVGDELLKVVAKRILAAVGQKGFVYRLGGDEFAVLVTFTQSYQNSEAANYLEQIAQSIKDNILQPYQIFAHHIQLGVSIGITQCMDQQPFSSDQLNEADIAMYEAKFQGRNRVQFYDEVMRQRINHIHKLQTSLSFAVEREEMYFDIQPQYGKNNEWLGGEVLLRWKNAELGQISPAEFIPLSEQSGVIHNIGTWLFEQAFDLVYRWMQQYPIHQLKPLAINISAKQFESSDFIHFIEKLMKHIPVHPGLIQFELTESLLLSNKENAFNKLSALQEMGFSLALDDFGTGYSCLSYLSQLPMNKLKIDRSFIDKVQQDQRQAAIVETIIAMANKLGLGTIAEGVETQEQRDFLISRGCFEFQGYFFSKPIAKKDYQALVNQFAS